MLLKLGASKTKNLALHPEAARGLADEQPDGEGELSAILVYD